jgi:hypothetical protein
MTGSDKIPALLAQRARLLTAAAQDSNLRAADVRIALLLLEQLHRKPGSRFGLMWPSAALLAQEACISRRWAFQCLKRLVRFGYFVRVDGTRGGRSITVSYQMGEPKNAVLDPLERVNSTSPFPNCTNAKGRSVVPERVNSSSPDPYRDPYRKKLSQRARTRERDGFIAAALEEFKPDAAAMAWAVKNVPGIDPFDPVILAKFKAHHQSNGDYPEDCSAAYRLWLLRERPPRPAKRNGHAQQPHRRKSRSSAFLDARPAGGPIIEGEWESWSN